MHRGKLTIDSALGRGTTVRVSMPPERSLPARRALRSQAG
jgi:hypothetical protein